MASLQYTSIYRDILVGNVNFGSDTFKCMLLTNSYTPSKNHTKRSDLTNEVTGTGYTAGGNAAVPTVNSVDTVNNRVEVAWSITSWTSSTITARYAAIYKSRGGAASADELVGLIDFTSDQSTSAGTFSISVTGNWRFQN